MTLGTNGDDLVLGTTGADVIRGLRGRDAICARGGPDAVRGGAGDDRIDAGAGADTVAGGVGRDRILGGGGGDRLRGERGDDTVTGGAGGDAVRGGPERDVMRGDAGDDTVYARDGVAEWPRGGSGRDVAVVDDLDRPAGFEEIRRPPTPPPPGRGEGVDFDTHVRSMAGLDQVPEAAAAEIGRGAAESSGDDVCTTVRSTAAPGYDELFLMDPASDVIYPGSIIHGDTIASGAYVPLVADRAPMTLSLSLENISGSPARTVAQPSLSAVRTAINDILAGEVTGATPARINYEIDEVFSQEQLALSLSADYRNPAVRVAAAFDYGKEDVRSRVVVKFQQIHYTIDVDLPASPAAMFRTPPDAGGLGTASPMYVSTVTYGRQILFTADSSYSASEVSAALAAGFKNAAQSVSFEVGARYRRVLENSSLKAYVLGGSGGQAAGAVVAGVDGLNALIATGGDYSRQSPGARCPTSCAP
ncbi:thiol-activated cytolysin family protein [Miltoncostaea marina]|uniref:thiol-activated cytolysin family protein n=1 Tax=Miltoncostaea marina TaxID=2843215 RepID=UPI001C3C21CE|nr:thiol-activated cytolysin family protein [Miltoncostaea marina]